jgi:zinc D-Ala-D-Ala dipeptidase
VEWLARNPARWPASRAQTECDILAGMLRRLVVVVALASFALPAQDLRQTFKIQPLRPIAELRTEALKAHPPAEAGEFRMPELVELTRLDGSIKLDIHYASSDNFLGTPVYTQARAFLQRPAAEAVVRANRKLHARGYGLLIFDGYRPWYITKMFWDATPPGDHQYVADPSQGSRHNRGCAVDLTIYELKTEKPLDMPSGYDDFTVRAHPDYTGGTARQRRNREFLRRAMEAEGFSVYPSEWWHFDYKDWRLYAILNIPFEDLNLPPFLN